MSALSAGRRTVSVYPRDWSRKDRFGNHVEAYLEPVSASVLIAPGTGLDLGFDRPEGVQIDLTLHFPTSWTDIEALRGAKVVIANTGTYDGTYKVVGAPKPYAPELVPSLIDLWIAVGVSAYDG